MVIIQFRDVNDVYLGSSTTVPVSLTRDQIEKLLKTLLKAESDYDEELEKNRYTFILETSEEIKTTLDEALCRSREDFSGELVFKITPDGVYLASGSGDATVRIWDLATQTPIKTFTGHTNWVMSISWSPDGYTLSSGGMDNKVIIWNPKTGSGTDLKGHTKAVTALSWQPLHNLSANEYPLLASGSMDYTVRIWDVKSFVCIRVLSGHTKGISQVLWSAEFKERLFSSSRDTLIKVWNTNDGSLVKDLKGHGHWINTLTSNVSRLIKSGPFSPENFESGKCKFDSMEQMIKESKKIYEKFKLESGQERLLSGSDDNTMFIWLPNSDSNKPVHRLTGHQQLINHVRYLFDSVSRIWCGITGKYLRTLRGHIGRVYRVAWSCRGNYLVSASSDSTLKLWDAESGKLKFDLPGHADQHQVITNNPCCVKCVLQAGRTRWLNYGVINDEKIT
uniref:NLE (NUC135) domain/WD domain, G-beta repeat, putative n=1 Tax=Theileria annulata TaxID=5874 RepID=A0A3B0MXM6_THEAN